MRLNTKNDIYLLMNSATPAAALGAAIETGLLWLLAAKPLGVPEVADVLNIPPIRCAYWLQVMEKMGILENGWDGYSPTSLAREAILETHSQESWQHLAIDERERSFGVQNLPLYISEPDSIWTAQGLADPKDYVEKMRDSPTRAREFTRMLFEVHQYLANQIATSLDLKDARRMMDLGGGSGVVSMALLRKYPALTATVVDIENVCIAGREIALEEGLSDRISYQPTEFGRDEFPTGFDIVLQCDVGVFGLGLYQKIFKSLEPRGRLILVEHFSPSENTAPATRLEWTFLDSLRDPDFSFPSIAQVNAQFAQAGFAVSPDTQTIGTGWIILQARRPEAG